jgi:hypothetical protein
MTIFNLSLDADLDLLACPKCSSVSLEQGDEFISHPDLDSYDSPLGTRGGWSESRFTCSNCAHTFRLIIANHKGALTIGAQDQGVLSYMWPSLDREDIKITHDQWEGLQNELSFLKSQVAGLEEKTVFLDDWPDEIDEIEPRLYDQDNEVGIGDLEGGGEPGDWDGKEPGDWDENTPWLYRRPMMVRIRGVSRDFDQLRKEENPYVLMRPEERDDLAEALESATKIALERLSYIEKLEDEKIKDEIKDEIDEKIKDEIAYWKGRGKHETKGFIKYSDSEFID